MDTLFNMRAFVCVAETGSFTAAAQRMSLTTSYVSRAVATLETHLRTRLLHRTTRRLALTEAGQRYLLRCEQILNYIDEAEAEAGEANAHPVGVLKVHAMTGIGQHYLIKAIAEYNKIYPDVSFDLTLANRSPDLLDEGYDVSMVIASELPDSGFISKHLGSTYSVLCASPEYLARRGTPRQVSDLGGHHCLRLINNVMGLDKWLLDGPDGQEQVLIKQTPFQVNTADAMTEAIKAGIGIGALPLYSAVGGLGDGSLVRVLPNHRLFSLGIYALYPSRQFLDAKTRTWVEFVRNFLPALLRANDEAVAAASRQLSAR
ncbi:LysR family transcriptional regulator [Pseudomonas sp. Gutcm_11s]|uniref:LysR family transcriptional regulator n=1 Tax=Pseudomonas sp. Gutcm_11s TaxID=3026088 RepID=UPI00235FF142|nr:LysR family transcriptional regulator [Pseudomonas sp. Gutcm_11s]MDD0842858.1 LysR family transcriptional regulator [Pseudomonas sp. Gutcm_11s]